ncbi:MAG: VWA domain-containing protein [Kiritimatiellae bacterium]|nr:VWA domain-containing protein [Kiritimatiellia bacterium]
MTLHAPWFLLLLFLVPILVFLRYGRRRRPSILFSDHKVLAHLPLSWAIWVSKTLPVFYSLALILLISAIARPQKGLQEREVHAEAIDIVLLVDVSTSMRAEDLSTRNKRLNRLDAAKQVIEEFIKSRKEDRISIVSFAALPYTTSPLTLDHGWTLQRMKQLKTGMLEDGTAIGSALGSAINRLRESEAKSKVVILLTDGVNNTGTLSPENAAQAARALDIKVYTVGAGTSGIVNMPAQDMFGRTRYVQQHSQIDEATLKRIAKITDAEYFRAEDFKSLKKVYEQIDEMERTEIQVEQYTQYEEKFMPFLIIAMILFGIERFLSLIRFGRIL